MDFWMQAMIFTGTFALWMWAAVGIMWLIDRHRSRKLDEFIERQSRQWRGQD